MPKPATHKDQNGTEYDVKEVTDPNMWAEMRRHFLKATLVEWHGETYWFDPEQVPSGYEPHSKTGVYRKVR